MPNYNNVVCQTEPMWFPQECWWKVLCVGISKTTVMDSQSLERKRSSFMIYDILDTKLILLPPQLPPSLTWSLSNNVRQGVFNYNDTPDNVSGDSKEHPSNPSVDAESPLNTEQGIYFIIIHVYGTIPGKKYWSKNSIVILYLTVHIHTISMWNWIKCEYAF